MKEALNDPRALSTDSRFIIFVRNATVILSNYSLIIKSMANNIRSLIDGHGRRLLHSIIAIKLSHLRSRMKLLHLECFIVVSYKLGIRAFFEGYLSLFSLAQNAVASSALG